MRRYLTAAFPIALLAIAGVFLVRLAREYARDLAGVRFDIDVLAIAGATALWLISYVFLVRLWAQSMAWWGMRVRLTAALRVFAAANLARYIPGGVWQFASLAAMSTSSGLSVVAVASAAAFQQIVLASVGLLIGLLFAPVARLGDSWRLPLPSLLAAVIAGLGALVFLLPPLTRKIDAWVSARRKVTMSLPQVSRPAVATYVGLSGLGWVGYAAAFVVFTHGILDPIPLSAAVLGASFVLSYVTGILAVFAPSGLIVREAALVALLAPAFGGELALALALAARLWLTVIDALLSLVMLVRLSSSADNRLP